MSSDRDLDSPVQTGELETELERKLKEAEIHDRVVSELLSAFELDHNLNFLLELLEEFFSIRHSMILTPDGKEHLTVRASLGYTDSGIGARVKIGEGVIGIVAKRKKPLRMPNLNLQVAYMMAVKGQSEPTEQDVVVKLPGLKNAKSQFAMPLLLGDQLFGVLALESELLSLYAQEDEPLILQVAQYASITLQRGGFQKAQREAIQQIDKLESKVERKNRETRIFEEVSSQIRSSLDLNYILDILLELLEKNFGFEHSMILLTNSDDSNLRVFASHGYDNAGIGAEVKLGDGVIGTVAKRKRIMRLGNINFNLTYMRASKEDSSDNLAIELPGLQNPTSQVAIPLMIQEELVGVLSVEGNQVNIFKEEDETLISLLANQAATAIQNARHFESEKRRAEEISEMNKKLTELNQEQQRTLNLFVRYVPEPVVQKALSDSPEEIFQGDLLNIAVLFCDIRDFTPLSERLEPNQVVYILNTYYTQMNEVIKGYDGVVNQYVGDEIFVTFGAPVSIENPQRKAALCALDMMKQLQNINTDLQRSLQVTIKVGIGVNFGPVVAGNLGSKDRIEYSVTGDTVNTAKRIESLTKTCPNSILISESILENTDQLLQINPWEPIAVKGKEEKIRVFEVLGLKQN